MYLLIINKSIIFVYYISLGKPFNYNDTGCGSMETEECGHVYVSE